MISPPTVEVANSPDTSAPTGSSPLSEPRSSRSSPTTPEALSPAETQASRIKSSARLNHWSRARAKRSGRKLSRPVQQPTDQNCPNSPIEVTVDNNNGVGSELQPPSPRSKGGSEGEHVGDATAGGKSIYMVSDATGWMAENSVNAALGQFEHCLADRGCAVSTHLFSGINDVDRLMDIIAHAAREGAMLVYTLADPSITEFAKQACEHWGVTSLDILGPVTEAIASHLDVSPSGLPRWASGRKRSLGEEYFRRIEAVEFTIKQDDGALPENLRNADIILAGVSRSGKTPLSIYLAQKGYKVANVPIVMNVELPRTLFEVDPEKVFALTINAVVLHNIRTERAKSLGFSEKIQSSYSDLGHVKQELEFANKIFQQNPFWPVIEVTGRAVEETAAFILKVYHDRTSKFSMPRISRHF